MIKVICDIRFTESTHRKTIAYQLLINAHGVSVDDNSIITFGMLIIHIVGIPLLRFSKGVADAGVSPTTHSTRSIILSCAFRPKRAEAAIRHTKILFFIFYLYFYLHSQQQQTVLYRRKLSLRSPKPYRKGRFLLS